MAISPVRWVGYALLVLGILFLLDTYTFLYTGWSPFHIPMYAGWELVLGYVQALCGAVLLLHPTLLSVGGTCAPDASMKMGQALAHESVELRARQRLPLKKRLALLPNRGLLGAPVILLLLVMFFAFGPRPSTGFIVRLTPRRIGTLDEKCFAGPLIVTVRYRSTSSQLSLNGTEVTLDRLGPALKPQLSMRANWEVFVEADDVLPFAEAMNAIDVIHSLHANAVMLTPKLKQQIAETCRSH